MWPVRLNIKLKEWLGHTKQFNAIVGQIWTRIGLQ